MPEDFLQVQVEAADHHPGHDVNFNEVSAAAWQKIKDAYGQASEEKLRWLQRSHRWLIASFVLVLIAVVVLVFLPTTPPH